MNFDYQLMASAELQIQEFQSRIDAIGQPKTEDEWKLLGYLASQKYEQIAMALRLAAAIRTAIDKHAKQQVTT